MSQLHDVIVIGTGAAGVSAAFPLVETGADVMLIDPGQGEPAALPTGEYLAERQMSDHQWRWLLGSPGTVARFDPRYSPKFRVPTMQPVFADLAKVLRIKDEDFFPVGSLATGGLTRAWGAGVSQFNDADLREFPLTRADLEPHYRNVAARIGICGPASDDISAHFGMDELTMPPVTLDSVGQYLETRYLRVRDTLSRDGFAMGRARLAVITRDQPAWQQDGRLACDERGFCLWGCPRRAIYTADLDLLRLQRYPNCTHQRGMLVDSIAHADGCWLTRGQQRATDARFELRSRRLILAAGVLSSTRLVLQLLGMRETALRLLSVPSGAFALLMPRLLGRSLITATGMAQHWFTLRGDVAADEVCGGLFPSIFLPLSEFIGRVPLGRRNAASVLSALLPSIAVGNLFFPSRLSDHSARLDTDGALRLRGGFTAEMGAFSRATGRRLRAAFRRLGAIALPGSFAVAAPGGDAHYAATLPMRAEPGPLQTSRFGALTGTPDLYVVDGSVLSSLPTKSHTLTIMANAERIGSHVARTL